VEIVEFQKIYIPPNRRDWNFLGVAVLLDQNISRNVSSLIRISSRGGDGYGYFLEVLIMTLRVPVITLLDLLSKSTF